MSGGHIPFCPDLASDLRGCTGRESSRLRHAAYNGCSQRWENHLDVTRCGGRRVLGYSSRRPRGSIAPMGIFSTGGNSNPTGSVPCGYEFPIGFCEWQSSKLGSCGYSPQAVGLFEGGSIAWGSIAKGIRHEFPLVPLVFALVSKSRNRGLHIAESSCHAGLWFP